jgi:hypothetical protein
MVEGAGRYRLILVADAERAGHAEVHEQNVTGGEVDREIFRAAADAEHGLALDPPREVLRQRTPQVRPAGIELDDAGALHHRLEAAPHGFDLGELGHENILSIAGAARAGVPALLIDAGDLIAPRALPGYGRAVTEDLQCRTPAKRISAFGPSISPTSRAWSTRSSIGSRAATT